MSHRSPYGIAGLAMAGLLLLLASAAVAADIPPTGSRIQLFDGKNLQQFDTFLQDKGWNNDPDHVFQVHDGMVHVSGKEYGYFITKKEYGDFYLRAEFKWGEETHDPRKENARDSGILYHVTGENKIWPKSIEFQIIEGGTGDIIVLDGAELTVKAETKNRGRFDRFDKGPWKDQIGYRDPTREVEKPRGQWNVVEMVSDGDHVTYWVNGVLVNEGTNASLTRGKILFQSEGAEIFFRKMELRLLKKKQK
jgi:hypothetical protein